MNADSQSHEREESNKIHLNESWEINRWCEELNLRAEELKEIIRRVGSDASAVRDYLARRNLSHEKLF